MNRGVMSVRLWLWRIRVLGVIVDAPEKLVVRVASTVRRPKCPDRGTPSGRTHDRRDREIRDLEVSDRPNTLVFEQRRIVCEPCGSRFGEDRPAFEGRVTARLARRLVADARQMTVNTAAKRHQVGWGLVNALVVAWAGLVGEHRRRRRCRVLLVEGTSIRKRHRYVTVLVNGETGEVLAMVPHRDSAALSWFLAAQGPKWCRRVKVVVSDGSKPYKTAIDQRLGHARHVLDRFHAIRWFAAGLTAVRRDTQRRPEGSTPAFNPDVFRSRFLLTRRLSPSMTLSSIFSRCWRRSTMSFVIVTAKSLCRSARLPSIPTSDGISHWTCCLIETDVRDATTLRTSEGASSSSSSTRRSASGSSSSGDGVPSSRLRSALGRSRADGDAAVGECSAGVILQREPVLHESKRDIVLKRVAQVVIVVQAPCIEHSRGTVQRARRGE